MLTIVRLGGELAKKYGKEFRLAIRRPIDAINLLQCSFPDFIDTLREYEKKGLSFRMTELDGRRSDMTLDDALTPKQPRILRLAPVVCGASSETRKANTQLAIAAVLVAVSFALGGPNAAGMTGKMAMLALSSSISFALQGALGHYSAHEMAKNKKKDFIEKSPSQMFSNVGNVTEPGGPVPVGYGTMLIGSTVVGVSVETYDIST